MNPWHHLDSGPAAPRRVNAVVEISKGSRSKYVLDLETGLLKLERILAGGQTYPANYAIIPRTLNRNEEALSVLILASEPITPLTLVTVKPIGGIDVSHGPQKIETIIAVFEDDPEFENCRTMEDVGAPRLLQIRDGLMVLGRSAKTLERLPPKFEREFGRDRAMEIIRRGMLTYQRKFDPGLPKKRQPTIPDSPLRRPSKASLH